MKPLEIVAICGSLRSQSSNLSLLKAAEILGGVTFRFHFYARMGQLPHFNPDDDGDAVDSRVSEFRDLIQRADGIVICTPEYVHGLPGSLKNAIDWTVSSGSWMDKPVLIINASPMSHFAHDSLVEILTTLMAKLVARSFPLSSNKLDAAAMVENSEISSRLSTALNDFEKMFAQR